MSGTFNGYHVWLGIPPDEQPPNHYRLLGIAAFETDLDVIEHAADRQMAHVRTFQAGRHGALSQQILNELAAARLCLLSPDKKTAYDQELRPKIGGSAKAAAIPLAKAVPLVKPVAQAVPMATPARKPAVKARSNDIALDLESFPASSQAAAPFHAHVKRRKYNESTAGKNAAILGVLMAVAVITGMALYQFLLPLLRTTDWNEIWGTPSPGVASPNEHAPRPVSHSPAPPPPAPSGQP